MKVDQVRIRVMLLTLVVLTRDTKELSLFLQSVL
jgi:hypothetical protein